MPKIYKKSENPLRAFFEKSRRMRNYIQLCMRTGRFSCILRVSPIM